MIRGSCAIHCAKTLGVVAGLKEMAEVLSGIHICPSMRLRKFVYLVYCDSHVITTFEVKFLATHH